ncbi:WD40 repeat-like protein [Exidia glandulosa HHB12029]|uniref:WD40 repeat-like protein n=1 Tax=Exidia glandulosa HHB12029 TaxID=1314781 RepID=A0A165D6Z7_EXIGL|nr:WD40 repeat-like protein [Exidia glandulosa HHB12029]
MLVNTGTGGVPLRNLLKSIKMDITNRLTVDFSVKVGMGGHSDVYRGVMDPTGTAQPVALKKYRFRNVMDMSLPGLIQVVDGMVAEMDIWGGLEHPNILRLYGLHFADEPDALPSYVSPWCDGGTMLDYLRSARARGGGTRRSPSEALALFRTEVDLLLQVTSGLAYLHHKGIIHGDVKGANVLIHNRIALLSDFGYSTLIDRDVDLNTSAHLGTQRWFAPEAVEPKAHRSMGADIWALGCVIVEAYTLQEPYSGLSDGNMLVSLHDGSRRPYTYPTGMNQSLWNLAEDCWSRIPKDRPNAGAVETGLRRLTTIIEVSSAVTDYLQSEHMSLSSLPSSLPLSSIDLESPRDLDPFVVIQRFTVALRYRTQGKDCLEGLCPTAMRPIARAIATIDPTLAEKLMANFGTPRLMPSLCSGDTSTSFLSVAFLLDGRLVSSSQDRTMRIWDIKTGKMEICPLEGHTNVRCVAVHGSRIASCSYDGTFRVWDAERRELVIGPIRAHNGGKLEGITFSRDGTHIATTGDENHVVVWDANTGVPLREMVGHTSSSACLAFSEDGRRLFSGSDIETVRIWDVASGDCIREPFTGHTSRVTLVCFSPDGKRMFSASTRDDFTIRIWDVETRALIVEPLRMDSWVLCMALSPDGTRLVSGSWSGKIALWDAKTGTAIPTPLKAHEACVSSVAFSPDGRKIASASGDKTIALWDATDDWKRYDIAMRM